ncbi:MAG: TNT domain-containing protein, partial [Clostridiales bacterium]|nr:TNT domain-containing protein [Clostridiales bacterium]
GGYVVGEVAQVLLLKKVSGAKSAKGIDGVEDAAKTVKSVDKAGDVVKTVNLWRKSECSIDELYNYLVKNVNKDVANKFLKEGKWPEGIQIPKNSSVLYLDGSINWSKAPEGGYTLNADGTAIKQQFNPKIGDVIDRYGNANGRYTSPVINGKSYSYTQRSLPYVEDLSNYHQYEVVGDFTKIKKYVEKCTDIKLKTEIEATVRKYYKGDYSRIVSYKGNAAAVEGWEKEEQFNMNLVLRLNN